MGGAAGNLGEFDVEFHVQAVHPVAIETAHRRRLGPDRGDLARLRPWEETDYLLAICTLFFVIFFALFLFNRDR